MDSDRGVVPGSFSWPEDCNLTEEDRVSEPLGWVQSRHVERGEHPFGSC